MLSQSQYSISSVTVGLRYERKRCPHYAVRKPVPRYIHRLFHFHAEQQSKSQFEVDSLFTLGTASSRQQTQFTTPSLGTHVVLANMENGSSALKKVVEAPDWFSEVNELWHGQAFSLKVKQVLHHEKSPYQDILVFERWVQLLSHIKGVATKG